MKKSRVVVALAMGGGLLLTSCWDKSVQSEPVGSEQEATVAADTVDLRSFVYTWVSEYADGHYDTSWTAPLRDYELHTNDQFGDSWDVMGPYKRSMEVCPVILDGTEPERCRAKIDTLTGTDTIYVNYGPDSLYTRSRRFDLPKPHESLAILPECSGKLFYATNSMDLGKFALKLLVAPAWLHLDSVPGECSSGYQYEVKTYEVDQKYFIAAPQSRTVKDQSSYLVVSEIPDSLGDSVMANWQVELTDRLGFKDTVGMTSTFVRR